MNCWRKASPWSIYSGNAKPKAAILTAPSGGRRLRNHSKMPLTESGTDPFNSIIGIRYAKCAGNCSGFHGSRREVIEAERDPVFVAKERQLR